MAKKKPKNIYALEEEWDAIDDAQFESNFTTRSEFMVQCALSKQVSYVNEFGYQVGRLGTICNEVLIADETDVDAPRLQGEDAKKAVAKIIEACDELIKMARKA